MDKLPIDQSEMSVELPSQTLVFREIRNIRVICRIATYSYKATSEQKKNSFQAFFGGTLF
ncbi:hypothetical protein HV431_12655 [Enterococcus faecium]|nr:hypothetical protein [Enterococcus faecium]